MPNYQKAKKKYVSLVRGCNFSDLDGFHTFLPTRKRTFI